MAIEGSEESLAAIVALGGQIVFALGDLPGAYLVKVPDAHFLGRLGVRSLVGRAEVQASLHREKRAKSPDSSVGNHPLRRVKRRADETPPTDPAFRRQWHLANNDGRDHNVTRTWAAGVRGAGVTVAVVDDGLDFAHADLAGRFVASASWDFNGRQPSPRPSGRDAHGTRCAGEVAAAVNAVCGVGIAHEAGVSGLRILGGEVTDATEAAALSFALQENAVYTCSWGPADDGATVEAPGYFLSAALKHGTEAGRGGLGAVYVFAAGNGGANGDNCNFDGYANSPYVYAVGAAGDQDDVPWYQEPCAAQVAVAYSSNGARGITTTDLNGGCTDDHGGTSAAAPLAAGVFALALSVRPELGWRDFLWLIAHTARWIGPPDDPGWTTNGAGFRHHPLRGFGLLDAGALVEAARAWTPVPPLEVWATETQQVLQKIPFAGPGLAATLTVPADAHPGFVIERVQAVVTLAHQRRGDVTVYLVSPAGTVSPLATPRPRDRSSLGLRGWAFSTVRCLGEAPHGQWTLRVRDDRNEAQWGSLVSWSMVFYGYTAHA